MNAQINLDTKMGVVRKCLSLHVRKDPSMTAEILGEVFFNSEVEINLSESTDDFYKICSASGLEGFCAKHYIKMLS